ncbi:MAG: hypothetical protein CMK60_12150 [Proteobacteria bacterium]|jgi:SAM-dependent methyltransferase|nr:hypothetical protein [Pseudomonadota bacterium]MDP6135862.1 methyltransferase domain-containing protein [Arenicellales bacterium]HJP10072.1 methyltransferase domain-containing protein [Arenicellales bacterium]|tara:strand:- start:3 stop:836 length:834 start_codon:yes stop_codon:yes gene_type:complete
MGTTTNAPTATSSPDLTLKESLAISHLEGHGVEFGPLNNPLPINSGKASVVYADRLSKEEALVLFPELRDIAQSIVEPNLIVDFNDHKALIGLRQYAFDFIIANHFIEHLVNPIRFLQGCSMILKDGAKLFLTIPDRDHTFDRHRTLTTQKHLWRDYQRGETTISNAHMRDFLRNKEVVDQPHPEVARYFLENNLPLDYYNGNKLPLNLFTRKRLYDFHRERSIHVHVWNRVSFDKFLSWVINRLDLNLRVLPTHPPEDTVGEMVYLLEKVVPFSEH